MFSSNSLLSFNSILIPAFKKDNSLSLEATVSYLYSCEVNISLSGETSPKDWDMAAPHAVIEAAGGSFSHADGKSLSYDKSDYSQRGCLIASHGKSHEIICQKTMSFFSKNEPEYSV